MNPDVPRDSRFDGGLAIENARLTVLIGRGARGAIVRTRGADAPSQIELRVLARREPLGRTAAAAPTGHVVDARLAECDENEAVVRFTTGTAQVELALRVGAAHVEVRPGKNAERLEAQASARYAIVPDFVGHDALYDAARHTSAVTAVPAENVLLQLVDGKQAILMLLWNRTPDAKPRKAKPRGAKPGPKRAKRKVELGGAGQGPSRRFTASRVALLGRPVYVALLQGSGTPAPRAKPLRRGEAPPRGVAAAPPTDLWHEVELRALPGAKTVPIGWKRPFDARWRADFTVEGFDESKVAAFLGLAARLGLSKGKEKSWRAAYGKAERTQPGSWGIATESYNFRTPNERGRLPRYSPRGYRAEGLVWPCVFRRQQTLLTPPARWPCYPDPTKDYLDPVQKRRAAEGKEPLYPIHAYGRAIIYPIDRTRKTPLTVYTVVDVMRETLGIGPCPWDWLEETRR